MATFYKVVSKITTRHSFMSAIMEVKADKRPKNTFKHLPMYDIYEDYFDTERDAVNFKNENSGKMIVYGK